MSTYVALEIGKSSLTAAVAESRPTGVSLLASERVELPDSSDVDELAAALQRALPRVAWARARLVLVTGGEQTQLRRLELPPVPADELPSMVKMLSSKELNATPQDAIDFVPQPSSEQGVAVIAARLDESSFNLATLLADRLGVTLDRMVLRPCATATLVKQLAPETLVGPQLLLAPNVEGTDIVALSDGDPVLIRSTRGSSPELTQADVRRTLPAATQLLGGRPTSLTILGSPAEETTQSTAAGDLPTRVIDLALVAPTRNVLRDKQLSDWRSLVGVIGAALEAAGGDRPAIDFLNPRKPGVDHALRNRQLRLAGLAAAAVIAVLLMGYGRLVSLDRQIADLQSSIARADEAAETFRPYQQQVQQLDAWSQTDVTWLDELEQLGRRLRPELLSAKHYPAKEDVFLQSLQLRRPSDGGPGGQMELQAAARSASVIGGVEQRLVDDRHAIQPLSVSERQNGGKYSTAFTTSVRVRKANPRDEPGPATPDKTKRAKANEESPAEKPTEKPPKNASAESATSAEGMGE